MQTRDYLIDTNGSFRFTKSGLNSQAPLLAKAGIDARSIKTYTQYIQARESARPYFMEYLREETENKLIDKPDTLEWQAIRSIVKGSKVDQEILLDKLKIKKIFKLI